MLLVGVLCGWAYVSRVILLFVFCSLLEEEESMSALVRQLADKVCLLLNFVIVFSKMV